MAAAASVGTSASLTSEHYGVSTTETRTPLRMGSEPIPPGTSSEIPAVSVGITLPYRLVSVVEPMYIAGVRASIEHIADVAEKAISDPEVPEAPVHMHDYAVIAYRPDLEVYAKADETIDERRMVHPSVIRPIESATITSYEEKGDRVHMEDSHFSMEMESGYLMGVFDGHGTRPGDTSTAKKVADFASRAFQEIFPTMLLELDEDIYLSIEEILEGPDEGVKRGVRALLSTPAIVSRLGAGARTALEGILSKPDQEIRYTLREMLSKSDGGIGRALEDTCRKIQSMMYVKYLEGDMDFGHMGCTAVVSYVDKKNNLVFTATIGDSEANIYRRVKGVMKSIPLSLVRDWTSEEDNERLKRCCPSYAGEIEGYKSLPKWEVKEKARFWYTNTDASGRRIEGGLNVSRSLGDVIAYGETTTEEGLPIRGLSSDPTLTVNPIFPGDVLVLACDGLKDHTTETDIARAVATAPEGRLAGDIGEVAFPTSAGPDLAGEVRLRSSDNITIIAAKFA